MKTHQPLGASGSAQSEREAIADGYLLRSEVLAMLKRLGENHADLALYGDEANARQREAMEAAFTHARFAVAIMALFPLPAPEPSGDSAQSQPCDRRADALSVGLDAEPSAADAYSRARITAVAEAWASIDGALAKFMGDDGSDPALGYRDGYEADAASLIERLRRRGFLVVAGLPSPPPTSDRQGRGGGGEEQ